ncbi:MAG: HAD family hydrolase [Deltaproteobacteria bacterium]|jgi:phosphoglycolate phosphatase|nr:HAD family hydrolase [Deltaproteobacteria bacterium]
MPHIPPANIFNFGAIFDLDGTIVDTLEDLAFSLNMALSNLGFPEHTVEEYRAMVGSGITRLSEAALPEGKRDEKYVLALRDQFIKDYDQHQTDHSKPYPGMPELLNTLKDLKLPLGVLTNKDHQNALQVVGHYYPGVFKAIIGAQESYPYKPDPKGALELCRLLMREPKMVFYFGDSDTDMYTAINAGCIPVGVSWGFRSAEIIKNAGARVVLKSPGEFFEVLPQLLG